VIYQRIIVFYELLFWLKKPANENSFMEKTLIKIYD